ncbi:hypothetical protein [Austwickia chelonae]|uniref:hypothetical protein n=1 Tax=Austwickia chelonae TaxID=100225 RepID=UPI000E25809D|nr:hypothetical protein [Austwickia chelonae]
MHHHPKRRLTGLGSAFLVLGMLIVPWAVPQAVTQAADIPTTTVAAGQVETLPTGKGKEVTFEAPANWQRLARTAKNSVTYTQGKSAVTVTVAEGVKDRQTAFDRTVRARSLKGLLFHLERQTFTTKNDFEGTHCSISTSDTRKQGNCAMITKDETLVVVSSLSESGHDPLDINSLIISLALKEAK